MNDGRVIDEIGGSRTFQLRQAILIYQPESRQWTGEARATATLHPVEGGRILPGQPITREMLEDLVTLLQAEPQQTQQKVKKQKRTRAECAIEAGLLPMTVLSISLTKAVWWTPAARRRLHFSLHFNKESVRRRYQCLNGREVLQPPMLFWADARGLRAFALARNSRPQLNTRLYQAPFFNTNGWGMMCQGSVKFPRLITPQTLPEFEAAFFDTFFTHATARRLTHHRRGHLGFWLAMRRARRVPSRWLVRTQWTVEDVLRGDLKEGHDEQPEEGQA
jgi:PRTRC genetic system protein B